VKDMGFQLRKEKRGITNAIIAHVTSFVFEISLEHPIDGS